MPVARISLINLMDLPDAHCPLPIARCPLPAARADGRVSKNF